MPMPHRNHLTTNLHISVAALLVFALIPLTGSSAEPVELPLWPAGKAPVGDGSYTDESPTITVYVPKDAKPSPAIVICPGGGYGGLAIQPEGHGIAKWLNEHGIVGIVLKYRMPKSRTMVPLTDALRAMRLARFHSKQWSIDVERLGVMGFSAGGHLASTVATQYQLARPDVADPVDRLNSRPAFAILVYPVITMGELTHGGSKRNLLGPNPSAELSRSMSSELQVTEKTPPCFLAHAKDDKPVPPINSKLFYDALQKHQVPSKYLELPNGGHGLNGYKGPSWDAWQQQSLEWLSGLKSE